MIERRGSGLRGQGELCPVDALSPGLPVQIRPRSEIGACGESLIRPFGDAPTISGIGVERIIRRGELVVLSNPAPGSTPMISGSASGTRLSAADLEEET